MKRNNNLAVKHFNEAFDYLEDNWPTMAMMVSKIGTPKSNYSQETAFVSLGPSGKRFEFNINPNFFDILQTHEKGFVVSHEASHVLYDHLLNYKDPYYTNRRALVIAQECQCNDNLIEMGMSPPDNLITGEETLGVSTAGMRLRDIYDMVLNTLPQEDMTEISIALSDACGHADDGESNSSSMPVGSSDPSDEDSDNESGSGSGNDNDSDSNEDSNSGSSNSDDESGNDSGNDSDEDFSDGSGQGNDATDEELKEARDNVINDIMLDDDIDYSDSNEAAPQSLPEDVSDAAEVPEGSNLVDMQSGQAGDQSGIAVAEALARENDVSIDFVKFLKEINPQLVYHGDGQKGNVPNPSFHIPNYRYEALTSAVMPVWVDNDYDENSLSDEGNGKPSILFALDMSGSVSESMTLVMRKLMTVIPHDSVNALAMTFSSIGVEYDLHSEEDQSIASGSTDFTAIHSYLDRYMKDHQGIEYPTVVVITDGGAVFNSGRRKTYYQDEAPGHRVDDYFNKDDPQPLDPPEQEKIDKNWKWLIFESDYSYYNKSLPQQAIYMSNINVTIDESTLYDLSDFVDY